MVRNRTLSVSWPWEYPCACLFSCQTRNVVDFKHGRNTVRKKLLFLLIPALLFILMPDICLFPQGVTDLSEKILKIYKQPSIKLQADSNFGTGTDWESLFFDPYKSLAVAPDGSVFVSNSRQHNIFRFSSSGKLKSTIGQKGEGPGDLYYPGKLSILDDKYLVVGQYATTRRISIFDLDGKFVKILKTNQNPFGCTALKNNKVAYMAYAHPKPGRKVVNIFSKDINSGKELLVTSLDIPEKNFVVVDQGYQFGFTSHTGEVFVAGTKNGNLLIGNSGNPEILIHSPEGKKIASFTLKIKPRISTPGYISRFKKKIVDEFRAEKKFPPHYINKLESYSFETCFSKHLPYYRNILVDPSGNILVFKWLDCLDGCPKVFQVYSPEGRFICETVLDEGAYDFEILSNWQNLAFTDKGIFGLFQLKNSEDISLRLVRVPLI